MTKAHYYNGRCWCGRRHQVYSASERRAMKRNRQVQFDLLPMHEQCYRKLIDRDRESVAVTLMQMESDGHVRIIDTPDGPLFDLERGDVARPFVERRFEVVA